MKKAAKSKSAASKKGMGKGAKSKAPKVEAVVEVIEPTTPVQAPIEPVVVPVDQEEAPIDDTRVIEPADQADLVPLNQILKPKRTKASAKAKGTGDAKSKGTNEAKPESKPKSLSCLDAAAQVIKDKGEPMRCKEMIEAMAAAGLWTSNAPTPAATLSSAILREMTTKGAASRFKKTDRGFFSLITNL